MPSWAGLMADFCHLLGCDTSQTLIAFTVNNRVRLAIVNMGAHRTVMSPDYVRKLGLMVTPAINGKYGRFEVPGSGIVHDYAGFIEKPFELRLG